MEQENNILEPKVIYYLRQRVLTVKMAICDDNKDVLEEIKPCIMHYANIQRLDLVIDEFNSGDDLLQSSSKYDIIILDYQMPGLDGLETAKILRERNNNCAIIFLTSFPQIVFEAFEVNTFRFLKKPVDIEKLYSAFDDYFKMYGNDFPILLHCNREVITLNSCDIIFIEAMNKNCMIHLHDQSLRCAKTMATVRKLLPKNHFYKVNRAFIVNFNTILKYDNDRIVFNNGESVHISRNYLTAFKTAYKNYSDLRNPRRVEEK